MMLGRIQSGTLRTNKEEIKMLIAILKSIWIPLIIIAVICGILGCIAGYIGSKIKHLEKELKHANEFFGNYNIEIIKQK